MVLPQPPTPPSTPNQFNDSAGRAWEIVIDESALLRIERATGIEVAADLAAALARMDTGEMVGRVLWCVCEPQAIARGIEPEQFAGSLKKPALFRAAVDRLIEGFVAACNPNQRDRLQRQWSEIRKGS